VFKSLIEFISSGSIKISTFDNNKIVFETLLQLDGDVTNRICNAHLTQDLFEEHYRSLNSFLNSIAGFKYTLLAFVSLLQVIFFIGVTGVNYSAFYSLFYPIYNLTKEGFKIKDSFFSEVINTIPFGAIYFFKSSITGEFFNVDLIVILIFILFQIFWPIVSFWAIDQINKLINK